MKRNLFTVLTAVIIIIAAVLTAAACTEKPKPADVGKVTEAPKQEETPAPEETPVPTETPKPEPTLEPLDIPYYSYEELLSFEKNGFFGSYDSDGYWACDALSGGGGAGPEGFLHYFPEAENAKRTRDESCFYYMMDTENDTRIFIFYDDHNDFRGYAGLPVFVCTPLEYEAFASLEIGDSIESVGEVDPSFVLHYRAITENQKLQGNFFVFEYWAEKAASLGIEIHPYSTLHYLTDGVLRIDYGLNEAGDVVIEAMTYGADWKLANAGGVVIDYRILPGDLDF